MFGLKDTVRAIRVIPGIVSSQSLVIPAACLGFGLGGYGGCDMIVIILPTCECDDYAT